MFTYFLFNVHGGETKFFIAHYFSIGNVLNEIGIRSIHQLILIIGTKVGKY